jgi:hypothetical protein
MPVTCHDTFTCGLFVWIVKRLCAISRTTFASGNRPGRAKGVSW